MSQVGTIEVTSEVTSEVTRIRDLALQVSRDQTVSNDAAEKARDTIRTICKEASRFGLTAADVVRAVFRPALEDRPMGCNCPTCRSRNRGLEPDELLPRDDVAKQSPAA